ncbi:hypothetical protein CBM2586_B20046 [Cupriavidus phytorum]|uniref:Uncharacterized protein n=1 Tax=Cupriavidus taiwanensis TaxID=164546 RepID=A0A375CKU1_9BURK|nr:hypothetical protein CBM2586_B20046 [Cupriavidus taiwanensis]
MQSTRRLLDSFTGQATPPAATDILPAGLPETVFHAPRLAARSGKPGGSSDLERK